MEFLSMDEILQSGREHCEFCVESLMSEEIGPLIANKEELLDRMLKYQEQILTAISIISPFIESVKSQEDHALKSYKGNSRSKNLNQFQTGAAAQKQNALGVGANNFQTSQQKANSGGVGSTLDILSSLFSP